MTKTDGLPKKTFLHPESDKDYYKRSSTGDILGKSRKNLSFVVPVTKLDERLKSVIWKKLKSTLPDLDSFDSREISAALEANLLVSRSPDEKKLNEELQQKIDKNLQKMDQGDLRIVHKCAKLVGNGNLTTEQKEEIVNFFKKFEHQKILIKTSLQQQQSITRGEHKQRTKPKGELKDTSQSRSTEETTSDEDGNLEQQSLPAKGKKETQKPKVSKPIKEYCSTDKETIQQQSRTTMGIQKPTSSKSTTQQKFPEGKKQTQNAKRKLKDNDSTRDRSSRKKPRLMQEQQMNENSQKHEAGERTK
jgi:hypothetical protein